MKILYFVHKVEEDVHVHVFEYLRSKGIDVDVETIGPAPQKNPGANVWKHINTDQFIDKCIKRNYDFIISSTHSNMMRKFYGKVVPKYKCIDVEHDIFSKIPQRFGDSMLFTFQEKHASWCKENNRKFIKCQWPKTSATIKESNLSVDKQHEAVIIGTYSFRKTNKLDNYGFDKVWYKKYREGDYVPTGVIPLPEDFTGPLGIKNCTKTFDFILTVESSCFVESLIFGSIPILLTKEIKKQVNLDMLFSKVEINRRAALGNVLAITTDNLEEKIKLLKCRTKYNEALAQLRKDWLCDDYFNQPTYHEALFEFITSETIS